MLARRFFAGAQHAVIEYFPGPQLLAEHLGACDVEIHGCFSAGRLRAGRGRVKSLGTRDKAVCEELCSIASDAPSRLLYRETLREAGGCVSLQHKNKNLPRS